MNATAAPISDEGTVGWLYRRDDVAAEGYAFNKRTIVFSLDRLPDLRGYTETPLFAAARLSSLLATIAEQKAEIARLKGKQ